MLTISERTTYHRNSLNLLIFLFLFQPPVVWHRFLFQHIGKGLHSPPCLTQSVSPHTKVLLQGPPLLQIFLLVSPTTKCYDVPFNGYQKYMIIVNFRLKNMIIVNLRLPHFQRCLMVVSSKLGGLVFGL